MKTNNNIITEDGGLTLAGIIVAGIGISLTAAFQQKSVNKIETTLLKCFDSDYLSVKIIKFLIN